MEADTLYKLETIPARLYNSQTDYRVMDLSFEMNLSQTVISRQIYSTLELISDIGGIQAILLQFFSIILSVFNYRNLNTFLASKLFKLKKGVNETSLSRSSKFEQSEYFQAPKSSNVRHYIIDCLPS